LPLYSNILNNFKKLCGNYEGNGVLQRPIQSGATLIVAPHSITHQWVDEVLRHVAVDALKIFV